MQTVYENYLKLLNKERRHLSRSSNRGCHSHDEASATPINCRFGIHVPWSFAVRPSNGPCALTTPYQ